MTCNRLVRKAVFPVAGLGTRFLPATKAMPKELLPIVDKPLIQYAAEEAISAGIDTLIFVTGRSKRAIEDHFDANYELEMRLLQKKCDNQAKQVRNILPDGVQCIFVRQPEQLGLGHAVLCAERAVGGEPFAVLLADDFLTDYSPGVTRDLVEAFKKTGNPQISYMNVGLQDVSKYGIIVRSHSENQINGLVEKPNTERAPSTLASIGRYLLTPDIFDILNSLSSGVAGELQLSDAINLKAQNGVVNMVELKGRRFDCGSVPGFVSATNHVYAKKYCPVPG